MRNAVFAIVAISTIAGPLAGQITVNTGSSGTATYGTVSETAGPFPWSDLGFTAGASVSAGTLNVNTGGSTAYTLTSTVGSSETFTPGSTTLNLGYNPAWTGSFATGPAANGNLNSQFVYNIGPISGSDNLFNDNLSAPGANKDLSSNLNAGLGIPAISLQVGNGLGIGATLTLSANAGLCPFCVTVASVSLGFNVGSQVVQTVTASPIVNYADLVWYSTTQTYSSTDTFTTVSGSGGNVANTFAAPSLSLTNGETFYMNILPVVELTMPVFNDALVAVPASITASWDVFGDNGSANYPLGNLFTLDNGDPEFNYDADFYGSQFYSIPLVYTAGCVPVACFASYETPPGTTGPDTPNGGIPIDMPPTVTITGGGTVPGGYGNTTTEPLFPGDPSTGNICGPAGTPYVGECINQVTVTPEPGTLVLFGTGLLLLAGAMLRRRVR
jgi:hypothetical protein